jgi:PKD repeat protein
LFLSGSEPGLCTLHRTSVGLVVPSLVGLPKADAFAALDAIALHYTVTEADVSGVGAGIIAAQTPPAGSRITSATVVALTVSTGGANTGHPPTAAFSWTPASPAVGGAVKFDASASTADGSITKWVWEFGDGVRDSSSGKIANHTYAAARTYDVVLWVTDEAGTTVSITKQVTVD